VHHQADQSLYVRVPDLRQTLDQVVAGGGKVLIPPTQVPGVVHFALFEDPAGNRMGIVQ
jgi:predicted enzyme related to lactoylglutathione lyase